MSSPSSTLRQRIRALTERFVRDLMLEIEQAPLEQLSAALPHARSREPGAADEPKINRRPHDEIERLRDKILRALDAAERPLSASQIARDAGVRTADVAFPMSQLRAQGIVHKQGERTQAVYRLVAATAGRKVGDEARPAPDDEPGTGRVKKKKKKTKR